MNQENFICEKQLAKRWRMSHYTLQNWRVADMGPAYFKIRGRVFYTQSAIEDFEASDRFSTNEQSERYLRLGRSYQQKEVQS